MLTRLTVLSGALVLSNVGIGPCLRPHGMRRGWTLRLEVVIRILVVEVEVIEVGVHCLVPAL